MEYFLNYGGVLILGFLFYLFAGWFLPLIVFGYGERKRYWLAVLAIHLFFLLMGWANYGLMLLDKK